MGQALFIRPLGPVSICNNRFVTDISGPADGEGEAGTLQVLSVSSLSFGADLILFNGNQSWLGQRARSRTVQRILSDGDISFNGNQSIALTQGQVVPDISSQFTTASRAGIFLGVFTKRRRLVYQQPDPLTLARSARLLVKISLKRLELISEPSLAPTAVIAPNLVGMTEEEALATLQEVGMQIGKRETKVAPEQAGRVLDQKPAAGSKAPPGSSVSLVIATQRDRARRSQRSTKGKR